MSMQFGKMNRRAFGTTLAALALSSRIARAESWPGEKAVTLVLPYAAGAGTDIVGRVAVDRLAKDTGGTFVMSHKPGAVTTLAARLVAKSPPDGHTLLLGSVTSFCMAPWSVKTPGYDPIKDFEHITMIAEAMYVLIANPRWTNLNALIAEAKKRPGELTFASWGVGSSAHLIMLDLMTKAGINLVHVPYNGSQPALTDLIGGRIDIMLSPQATANAHVIAGKATGLAVLNKKRITALPGVPTIEEIGLSGLRSPGWISLDAPAGTPSPILEIIANSAKKAFTDPATRAMLDEVGMGEVEFGTEALNNRIRVDSAYLRDLMVRAGVVPT